MIHVAEEILWISPVVDLILFLLVALLIAAVAFVAPRVPGLRVLVFVLSFLAFRDLLSLTGRLQRYAILVLAAGVAVAMVRWFARNEVKVLRACKISLPWLVAGLILVFVAVNGGKKLWEQHELGQLPPAATGAPNIVVIVVDTLRADHVSSYGYNRPTTPEMDRIAAQGVAFDSAIATSSWSLPSHASLLTGRYVFEHGVGNVEPEPWLGWGDKGLGGRFTLGEELGKRGYRSGAFSANRTYFSRDLGFGRSFIHFEDYFHSAGDMFVRTVYGREFARRYFLRSEKSQITRTLRRLGMESLLDQDAEGSGSSGGAYGIRKRGSVVNEETLSWIDRDRERPFFVFLNYFDVHSPYGAPRSYPEPAWSQNGLIDKYDDGVKYADDHIAELMKGLENRGLAANTLVIITSDHGESLDQHGLPYHGHGLYRELIRVPLIFWYPGHIPEGVRVSVPVTNSAIPATVIDLLRGGPVENFRGPGLDAAWNGANSVTDWPSPLSELAQNIFLTKQDRSIDPDIPTAVSGSMKSLVTPQWHLITHEKLGDQIYDWKQDPAESHNLIHTPQGAAAAADLHGNMERIIDKTPSRVGPPK